MLPNFSSGKTEVFIFFPIERHKSLVVTSSDMERLVVTHMLGWILVFNVAEHQLELSFL